MMRQRGNLRLLLNGNLWSDMAVNKMDGGLGVTFALHNAAAVRPPQLPCAFIAVLPLPSSFPATGDS